MLPVLERGAFDGCKNLKDIVLPSNLKYLGKNVFRYCESIHFNEYDNAYYIGNDKNPYFVLVQAKSKKSQVAILMKILNLFVQVHLKNVLT